MNNHHIDLSFTSDDAPGFSRRRCGKGFAYYDEARELIREPLIRTRIEQLAIPPAYRDVWICPLPQGHLQATRFDNRERKQYRYHADWRKFRNEKKFEKLLLFAEKLPAIRRKVRADLDVDDHLSKQQVVAAAIRLIDHTGARVGNDIYTSENGTHGISTLEAQHVIEDKSNSQEDELRFRYRGKGGRDISFELKSPAVAEVIHKCSELAGERLFQYEGQDGEVHSIHSQDINEYIQQVCPDATAKDFRTWKATLLCFSELSQIEPQDSEIERSKSLNTALKRTAAHLYHKPSTCREYYVHPNVIGGFLKGEKFEEAARFAERRSPRTRYSVTEQNLLEFLEKE